MEKKLKKTVKLENEESRRNELLEQITETTFQRTRTVHRGAAGNESASSDSDVPQVEWKMTPKKRKDRNQPTSSEEESRKLMSFWDLVGSERTDREKPENMLQLEASTELISPQRDYTSVNDSKIIEVDLTADTTSESPEVSLVAGRETKSRQQEFRQAENREENNLLSLSKLFDRNLLAELTTEDTWMDRLRRVIERKDPHIFELMGYYTTSLWHQMTVVDDCIVVDGRLAVPGLLLPAVLKRIHRGHPGQEAMIDVSKYLWWPHMHKDIVNMAEECRSCTRSGKNAKYIIPKNASKPLPLLSQPGQELQLDYAGPLEDTKGKIDIRSFRR